MQTTNNAVMIVSMVAKGVADDVANRVREMTQSKISIFYGSVHSGEKGFLGIPLNDEVVEILCVVEQSEVDGVVNAISEIGRMDELGRGYIVTIPSVGVTIPSPKDGSA